MNSYRRSKDISFTRTRGKTGAIALTAIVLCLGLADFLLGGAVRDAARTAVVPFANFGRASVAAVSSGDFFSSRAALLRENAELRLERDRLQAQGMAFEALRNDIEALQEMARLAALESEKGDSESVTAPVISSLRASPYGTFLIGAGLVHGVQNGSIVLGDSGFAIGSVSDVSNRNSVVRMFFSPGQTADVVSGSTGFSITGHGGGNASAEVPRESLLNEGDAVLAPTLGNRPVGIIGKIASSTSSAYADVYIVYPRNLNTVRYVHVVPGF